MAENDQRTQSNEDESPEETAPSPEEAVSEPSEPGSESEASEPEVYVPDYAQDEPDEGIDSLFLSPDDSESELVEVISEVVDDDEDRAKIIEEFEARITALEEERDDFKNRMMRVAADLENFRKRAAREKEELRKFGIDRVVLELLPVIDNLERALAHATESENEGGVVDGVRMVYKQFVSALEKHGVKGFESKGDMFDPQKHEAIQQVETAEHDTNTVLDQYQKGYWLHERLIRPALVSVAKRIEVADNEFSEAESISEAEIAGADEPTSALDEGAMDSDVSESSEPEEAESDASDGVDDSDPSDDSDASADEFETSGHDLSETSEAS